MKTERNQAPGSAVQSRRIGRLHVITDTTLQSRYTHAELAERAVQGGADTIQYRSKSLDVRTMIREAGEVAEVCRRHGVLFLVNDRIDVALAVDADGVHLGREDMPLAVARRILGPGKVIGGTIRGVDHLWEAIADSADYVGLGPIFRTGSKRLPIEPLGLDAVRAVTSESSIPIIAIAGISVENIASVISAGAFGVAVIGAVCAAGDVTEAARALHREIVAIGRTRS